MNERPVSTTLLTAFALWALWLWARHRLGPAPTAGPSLIPGAAVPPPPGLFIPVPDHLPVLPSVGSGGPYQ